MDKAMNVKRVRFPYSFSHSFWLQLACTNIKHSVGKYLRIRSRTRSRIRTRVSESPFNISVYYAPQRVINIISAKLKSGRADYIQSPVYDKVVMEQKLLEFYNKWLVLLLE